MFPRASSCAYVLLAGLLVAGCGKTYDSSFSMSPQAAVIEPGQSLQFATSPSGYRTAVAWSVNGISGGNTAVGTINSQGNYTAPTTTSAMIATIAATTKGNPSNSMSASVTVIPPGQVTPTANPQVALYSISLPSGANVSVEFGTDASYGLTTWTQPAPANGGTVSIFVAGMRASTAYHIRGIANLGGGLQFTDADNVFTTGALPANQLPPWTVATTPGTTPQPGVEMLDLINANSPTQAAVTDLAGNLLWSYSYVATSVDDLQPIKLLPNGHFLVVIGPNSSSVVNSSPAPSDTINVAREIDLAGDTIRELSIATLNARLASAGYPLVALSMHHDIEPLPNGHWIVLVNTTKQFTNLPGYPGTTTVLGDALVDLDTNLNPVWTWSSFDHMDVNRQPMNFPDWTHANAILYSADDGDLVVSMRHQNWILKIDYDNGNGTGNIVWHLGNGGDFTLKNGQDPDDWFYAQHLPSFVSPNTSGVFSLAVFDNGDDRQFSAGVTCGAAGMPLCLYSTVPILQVDETAKTATLVFHDNLSPLYSFFGGNAEVLANGNVEFDMAGVTATPASASVYEVTQTATPQTIWQMHIPSAYAYRAFRMPSLYPGVQW